MRPLLITYLRTNIQCYDFTLESPNIPLCVENKIGKFSRIYYENGRPKTKSLTNDPFVNLKVTLVSIKFCLSRVEAGNFVKNCSLSHKNDCPLWTLTTLSVCYEFEAVNVQNSDLIYLFLC